MKITELLRLAVKNFLRRKMRSLLTILGVVIGTAAVVIMLSLGIGLSESFTSQIGQMGSLNMVQVHRWYYDERGNGSNEPATLNDRTVEQIAKIKGVSAASPVMQSSGKIISGKYMASANLMGMRGTALEAFGYTLRDGRYPNAGEDTFLIFGSEIENWFYNPKSRVGNVSGRPPVNLMLDKMELTLDWSYGEGYGGQGNKPSKIYKMKTAGVLEQMNDQPDWSIIVDIDFLKKAIKDYNQAQGYSSMPQTDYDQVLVRVNDINDVQSVVDKLKEMKLGTYSLQDVLKSVQDQLFLIQAVLGGIGAVSLLVAAIGIMNTMVMSIYERTREIGVMKVLGCLITDIRKLFLLEAAIIGFTGGTIGVALSCGASFLLNTLSGGLGGMFGGGYSPDGEVLPISVIPPWLAVTAVLFAMLVGIVSGFYPANRAMKLSALDAIKNE